LPKRSTNTTMENIICVRFLECLDLLRERKVIKSDRQFAQSLGVFPQTLNEIRKGRRKVTIDLIHKSAAQFDFNTQYIFTGKGSLLAGETEAHQAPNESDKILTVVVSSDNREKIVHVPIAAQAGYNDHLHNPIFFRELPVFSLPDQGFDRRTQRCFDVAGDSMEPSIYNGEKVICSFIEPDLWSTNIRSGMVYIIVTQSEILVKRVENELASKQQLVLKSDNSYYAESIVHGNEIKEIWVVTQKISNMTTSYRSQVAS